MVMEGKKNNRAEWGSIILCWLVDICIYFARLTYTANIGIIEEGYHVTHAEAGLVMTFFSVAYGIGQFVNGIFCKNYPKRVIVPLIMFISAIMDILIVVGIPFKWIKYVWLLGGICQSALWPLFLQVISENVGDDLINKAILLMCSVTCVGTILVYGLSACFAATNYKMTFLISAFIVMAAGIAWFIFYRPGHYLEKAKEKSEEAGNSINGKRAIILLVGLLAVLAALINFAKDGMQTWIPVILKNIHGMGDDWSIVLTLVLPIFGAFGGLLSVSLHKKIKGTLPLLIVHLIGTLILIILAFYYQSILLILVGTFGILQLFLHSACSSITGIFPLEMRAYMSTGMLTGILNGSAYLGNALSAYILGKVADNYGWNAVFVTLICIIAFALMASGIFYFMTKKKTRRA